MEPEELNLKEKLVRMYWSEDKSYREIAKELSTNIWWVSKQFEKYAIRVRSYKKAHKLSHKNGRRKPRWDLQN